MFVKQIASINDEKVIEHDEYLCERFHQNDYYKLYVSKNMQEVVKQT